RATPLDGVLGLFYGTLAASTLVSGHPLEATGWARLWVVLTYFVVFWWLRDRRQAIRFVHVLVGAGALAAAYGLLQHETGADWYRAALGRPLLVHPRETGGAGYAIVGFFRNYLTFAHTMLFPLAWATASAMGGALAGLGRYQRAAQPFYAAHPEADRHSHAHNDYLQIAAEAGLTGLAAFGLLFATALRCGWAAIAEAPDAATRATAAGAWAGLVGFLVGGVTQYNFGDNEVAIAMWVALAVLMRLREP